ncbi:transcriptional regulator [Streptomyces cyaneogriseus subsp. noncyanogenus]|uniref:Cys-tRNA(Pro)/Cys-tRNA(Cys) deacylase n=1 Tax=Streptomyces cyaneogriseus subsp. noncyanogenus TaxID=477245 RepID=A0A0C5FNY3_9ACTN|nr:Cys-tRNA(Pro) deacylase [Streptomyces cyaneogriseus]AJP01592.1 transcriptional regulator [Streptomyces cyaneogriseus subsp. noncyanogenus]
MAKKAKKQQLDGARETRPGKGGGRRAGGTPATVALAAAGVRHTVHSYEHDPAHPSYGEEAAEAMGVSPDRVFKTLVADVDGTLTVAVVPVAGQLDLKALAAAVGGKRAAMADPALAERTTGYVRGGISPLGQRKKLPTVLDSSAAAHGTICVSAGRRGLEVELAPDDLARLTDAVLAPVGRA